LSVYALDIETTGLDPFTDRLLGIGIYHPTVQKFFTELADFKAWLSQNQEVRFVCHRGSFDINFLRRLGCDLRERFAYDTRSLGSILVPQPALAPNEKHVLSLQNLGVGLLGLSPWKLDREDMGSYSLEEVAAYCLKDCEVTYELFEYMLEKLAGKSWEFVESWVMPATRFCADLEYDGVHIDAKGLSRYQQQVEAERDRVKAELTTLAEQPIRFYHEQQVREVSQQYKEMYEKAKLKAKDQTKCLKRYALLESAAVSRLQPFNWNSPEQLKWLLRDYYSLDILSDREDKETTNEAMLKSLDHPVAQKLVEYRELEKLCSTCIPALIDNLGPDGNVHASYNVGGTRTCRLSSSGPNLQQIPKGQIRSYIKARPGYSLVTIDYAQIEVRIIAEVAQERELIDAFKEEIDPYSVIAQKLLKIDCPVREIKARFKKERDVSKTAGLSIFYGTGAAKLQEVLKKDLGRDYSLYDCRRFIKEYRDSFPGVKDLRARLDRALANRKTYYNLLGRPFYIQENDDIYMKGMNTLVQGSASDLVIWSQTNFVLPALKELGVECTPRMIIHDEVVLELRDDEAQLLVDEVIVPAMTSQVEQELGLSVPLAVEFHIGPEWAKP
jgi:DNA polymerase I-like protein with 3'-5' exonuclease and polymerase domains